MTDFTTNPVLAALKAKHDALANDKAAFRTRAPRTAARNVRSPQLFANEIPYVKKTDARSELEKVKYPFVYRWDFARKGWVIVDAYGNTDDKVYEDRDECAAAVNVLNVANARALGYKVIG